MKTRIKHLFIAAIPYWAIQLILLLSGYTDRKVVLQIDLPIFIASAVALLLGKFWVGHGLWLFASVGLVIEWVCGMMRSGPSNTRGILLNGVILVAGVGCSLLIQVAVDTIKKKKAP